MTRECPYVPERPLPSLGRDSFRQTNARVTFSENSVQLHIPCETAWEAPIRLLTDETLEEPENNIPATVLNVVIPLAWAAKKPGKAKTVTPIKIERRPGVKPVGVNQHPVRREARKGLEPLINTFMEYGLLGERQPELNIAALPVKKLALKSID